MQIGIDSHFLEKGVYQGSATYTRELLLALSKIDDQNKYKLLVNKIPIQNLSLPTNFQFAPSLYSSSPKNVLAGYGNTVKKYDLDILHCNYYAPLFIPKQTKVITTIHDILHISLSNFFPSKLSIPFRLFLGKMLRRSDSIIAVSNFTKQEVVNHFNLEPDSITVIYEGVSCDFIHRPRSNKNKEYLKVKYGISGEYILFVGRFAPIKNLDKLIRYADLNPDKLVVMVGDYDSSFPNQALKDQLDAYLGDNIVILNSVGFKDLQIIYSLAYCLYFVSYGEGFGLPILEAMKAKIPVITSNITACSEIAGDAAIKVDPNNFEAITDGLNRVFEDSNLRDRLVVQGIERELKFSWDNCARQTLALYNSLM